MIVINKISMYNIAYVGTPMPQLTISEEAVRRRAERKENEEKRAYILASKKKNHAPVPPRPQGPLDSNSVAARRLAAKRGESISGPPVPVSIPSLSYSSSPTASESLSSFSSWDHPQQGQASNDFFTGVSLSTPVVSAAAADLFFDSSDDVAPVPSQRPSQRPAPLNKNSSYMMPFNEVPAGARGHPGSTPKPAATFKAFGNGPDEGQNFSQFQKFDAFEPSSNVVSNQPDGFSQAFTSFDPFAEPRPNAEIQSTAPFNPFSQPSAHPASYDPFSLPASATQNNSFGSVTPAASFDPFGNSTGGNNTDAWSLPPAERNSFSAPSQDDLFSQNQIAAQNPPFDPFANTPAPVLVPNVSSATHSNSFLDDFAAVPVVSSKKTTDSLLNLFDATPANVPVSGMNARGTGSAIPANVFAVMPGPHDFGAPSMYGSQRGGGYNTSTLPFNPHAMGNQSSNMGGGSFMPPVPVPASYGNPFNNQQYGGAQNGGNNDPFGSLNVLSDRR